MGLTVLGVTEKRVPVVGVTMMGVAAKEIVKIKRKNNKYYKIV